MTTIAIVRATEADAAQIRYRLALRLNALLAASRLGGAAYVWVIRAA